MWTVVYVSQVEETARKLVELLKTNEIISRIQRRADGAECSCFEVLVPQTELDAAQILIFENEF